MKKILRIARLELSTLFYSPIAWFLLIVFLVQNGLVYIENIKEWLVPQRLGGSHLRGLAFLTIRVFGGSYGVFTVILEKLYLYLPLLTMGLMSREISSGTIKLLYSSPVKAREIILGKFLAMMVYNLLLTGVLAIFVMAALFNIQSPDTGMLFSGLLGIYLLLCAYAAIGLFMSCLTSYQVVAALSTLVLFALLEYVGTLWQDKDFVRDLTYFLAISGRTDRMIVGLISSKDVLYFAAIIYIFLGFSISKLQGDRESRPGWLKAGRYVLIIVSALGIGYVSSRPGLIAYYDATDTKANTLRVNTQKIVKEIGDAPLEVTSYINLLDTRRYFYGEPSRRNQDMNRWEPYLRFKPDIRFNYVYYYDSVENKNLYLDNPDKSLKEIAKKYAISIGVKYFNRFKTPAEIRQLIDLRPEKNRYVMQLKYKDRSTFLRLFDDNAIFPSETETGAALKRLAQAKLPKIAFVEGELERGIDKAGDRNYKALTNEIFFRHSLVNQGFDMETLSLKDQAIPTDIAALVIADPKTVFDTAALDKIRQYIAGGGNLLITGEPGKQAILNPILQPLGVQLMDGELVQKSKEHSPDLIQSVMTDTAVALSRELALLQEDSLPVTMPGAAGLTYTANGDFDIKPLLMTDGKTSWNKKGKLVADSAEVGFSAVDGDQSGAFPTALRLTRPINGKEQRIVVTGHADFLSNAELGRQNVKIANFYFGTAIFSWFTYGQFPIDTWRAPSKDTRVRITDKGVIALKVFILGILPGLLLLFGTVLLIRRRRK